MNTGAMLPSALLLIFLQVTVTSSAGTMTKPMKYCKENCRHIAAGLASEFTSYVCYCTYGRYIFSSLLTAFTTVIVFYVCMRAPNTSCLTRCFSRTNWSLLSVLDCPYFSPLNNGRVRYFMNGGSDYTAVFSCKRGYAIIGDNKRVCQNGTWNQPPPTCKCK